MHISGMFYANLRHISVISQGYLRHKADISHAYLGVLQGVGIFSDIHKTYFKHILYMHILCIWLHISGKFQENITHILFICLADLRNISLISQANLRHISGISHLVILNILCISQKILRKFLTKI